MLITLQFTRNRKESEQQQDMINSQFCAIYLPDTVSRYLDLPQLHPEDVTDRDFVVPYQLYNSYLETIVRTQRAPYFVKYLRSNAPIAAPGKRLPAAIAQRLLDLAPHLDPRMQFGSQIGTRCRAKVFYLSVANNSVKLLNTLLSIFKFSKMPDQNALVPAAVQEGLLKWLKLWEQRYPWSTYDDSAESRFGSICWVLWAQLSPEMDVRRDIKIYRRVLKNEDECALPSCSVKDNCKVCAKCKTVRYCSVGHQRAHWNFRGFEAHKHVCFETPY